MRNQQIRIKLKARNRLNEDLETLVKLGFIEIVKNVETGEEGYRITTKGEETLKQYDLPHKISLS
jgi:predicted transcriptional regulator